MANETGMVSQLSLRYLPDVSVSDASLSLSFQIPQAALSADLLLADDTDDFFKGVNESFMTPALSKRTNSDPLTISQSTPTRGAVVAAAAMIEASPSSTPSRLTKLPEVEKARVSPEKTPGRIDKVERKTLESEAMVDSPVSAARFASLKAEVDLLGQDETPLEPITSSPPEKTQPSIVKPFASRLNDVAKSSSGREDPKLKLKPTVVGGGVTKKSSINKQPQSSFSREQATAAASRQAKPTLAPTRHMIRPSRESGSVSETAKHKYDGENMSTVPSGGVAERLLLYGQELITNSLSTFENVEDLDMIHSLDTGNQKATPSMGFPPSPDCPNNDPFTLSQISPRKGDANDAEVTGRSATSPSPAPTLSDNKRAVPDSITTTLEPRKKKAKTVTPLSATLRSSKPTVPAATQSYVRKNNVAAYPKPSNRSTRLGPQSRQALAVSGKGQGPPGVPVASSSRQTGISSKRTNMNGNQSTSKEIKSGSSSTIKNLTLPLPIPRAHPTKPVGFTFHSDARVETRKAELTEKLSTSGTEKRTRSRSQLSIPDFKALHEAELQASLAFRREHVAPTIPIAPELNTQHRAKEREKFDEMVRRKEDEMERVKEERRRALEEEEMRLVKELRKKAIPKANEVPEWYADAPKRGGSSGIQS